MSVLHHLQGWRGCRDNSPVIFELWRHHQRLRWCVATPVASLSNHVIYHCHWSRDRTAIAVKSHYGRSVVVAGRTSRRMVFGAILSSSSSSFICSVNTSNNKSLQEKSWWPSDAPYMDALNIFGSPWLRPRLLFPKMLMGFCCNRSY